MQQYLDIVDNILCKGRSKDTRAGKTIVCPNQFFSHEMHEGFPACTTKKLAFRTMAVELEGFIRGITSKSWYQKRKCKIWDEWANPVEVDRIVHGDLNVINNGIDYPFPDRKKIQKRVDDLGPIYGYQWRKWNEVYSEDCDGQLKGIDQLKMIVDKLKENPDDRRLVVSAWNPSQIESMALPPCHLMWILTHIDGELSLHWTQRSCDMMLGVPFNIASYGLLLELLCKDSGLKPGNLSGTLCDAHIYENQIEVAKEQLKRKPRQLPKLKLHPEEKQFSIFDWTHDKTELIDYNPHSKLDFGEVAV